MITVQLGVPRCDTEALSVALCDRFQAAVTRFPLRRHQPCDAITSCRGRTPNQSQYGCNRTGSLNPSVSRSANPRSAVRGRFRDLRCPRRDFKAQLGHPRYDDVEENAQRRRMTHLYTGCHAFAGRWANAAILPRHCSPGAPRRMYGRGLHPKDRAATGWSLPV